MIPHPASASANVDMPTIDEANLKFFHGKSFLLTDEGKEHMDNMRPLSPQERLRWKDYFMEIVQEIPHDSDSEYSAYEESWWIDAGISLLLCRERWSLRLMSI